MLQKDLKRLQDWERYRLMAFNPSQCELIRFTKKRNPFHGNYNIHGLTLKVAKSGKYMGVTLSDDLKWNRHVDAVTKKANNSLAFLRRNMSNCSKITMAQCQAYSGVFILSLEPAYAEKNIKELEAVQRRAVLLLETMDI